MTVLGTGVHVKVAKEFGTEARLGKHTANGLLYDAGWMLGKLFSWGAEALTSGVSGVANVLLVVHLIARQGYFSRVDDNDIVTTVNVGGVIGLVLAAKAEGNMRSQSAEGLTLGVNHNPGFTCGGLGG